MKVFSMTVDKRPYECLLCPIHVGGVKLSHEECGKKITTDVGGGWKKTAKVPDERCLIHEIGGD